MNINKLKKELMGETLADKCLCGKSKKYDYDDENYYIEGNEFHCGDNWLPPIKINFCPICGRKVKNNDGLYRT